MELDTPVVYKNKKGKYVQDGFTQSELIQKDYVPIRVLTSFNLESLAFPQFIQNSHNIFALLLATFLIGSYRYYSIYDEGLRQNGQVGFKASMFMIILYGTLYFPNLIIQRPHPVFWRLVHSISICWLIVITYASAHTKEDMQKLLVQAVDPNLGPHNYYEKSYDQDCSLLTPGHPDGILSNIKNGVIDLYFIAHLCGWFYKMLIVRNFWICQVQSILFEFLELTFKVWLENFSECWWDSIILDLIIANTGGMILGMLFMKIFNMQHYSLGQTYNPLKSSKRFGQIIFILTFQNMVDLSHFFNKYTLKIAENHSILSFRIFLVGFLSIPAFKEYLTFISDKSLKRIGPAAWTIVAITCIETLLFFRNYDINDYQKPIPVYLQWFWLILFLIIFATFIILLIRDIKRGVAKKCKREIKLKEKFLKKQKLKNLQQQTKQ